MLTPIKPGTGATRSLPRVRVRSISSVILNLSDFLDDRLKGITKFQVDHCEAAVYLILMGAKNALSLGCGAA
jgi:hypothetical protein